MFLVFIVNVELPVPLVIELGAKVLVVLTGKPVTDRMILPLKPDKEASVRLSFIEELRVTIKEEDAVAKLKSPIVIVLFTVVVWPIVSVAVNATI